MSKKKIPCCRKNQTETEKLFLSCRSKFSSRRWKRPLTDNFFKEILQDLNQVWIEAPSEEWTRIKARSYFLDIIDRYQGKYDLGEFNMDSRQMLDALRELHANQGLKRRTMLAHNIELKIKKLEKVPEIEESSVEKDYQHANKTMECHI